MAQVTKHTREYYRGHLIYKFGPTWYAEGDSVFTVQAPSKKSLLKKLDARHQAEMESLGVTAKAEVAK